jgi:CheY-like chemotaxis protein
VQASVQAGAGSVSAASGRPFSGGEAAGRQAEPIAAAQGARILLADDNEINRLLITTLLDQAGYRVETANDGAEAVAAARAGGFALVLMDIQMPNMDGIQATEAIRALPGPERTLPIIALTANAMASHRAAYLRAGMNDYLSKPIEPERMLRTIAVWVDVGVSRAEALSVPAEGEPLPTLDTARLGSLRALLPHDQLRTVITTYLDRDPLSPASLPAVAGALDLPATARLAHGLKGSSGSLGAARLQHAAARLETACLEGDRMAAAKALSDLSEAERQTRSAMRAWLDAETGA